MQVDMHYYGTLAMALKAGIPDKDAKIIAYAAQFVDDASSHVNGIHSDGGMLVTFTTSHDLPDSVKSMAFSKLRELEPVFSNTEIQRKVWVPNHFLPGGEGDNLQERSICLEDSKIANEMFDDHIGKAINSGEECPFGLHLLGVAAHAYLDTFSHYGFSGFSTEYNKIKNTSIKAIGKCNYPKLIDRIASIFNNDVPGWYLIDCVKSEFAESGDSALGHGAVMSLPDMPFLEWEFDFELKRPGNGTHSYRNNPEHFARATKALYKKFCIFAKRKYDGSTAPVPYENFADDVLRILKTVGRKPDRIKAWYDSGLLSKDIQEYDSSKWSEEITLFGRLASSRDGLALDCYKFHQAATYHRYYVLKDLLPRYGVSVY